MSSSLLPDSHLNLLAYAVKEYAPESFTDSHQSLVDILRDARLDGLDSLFWCYMESQKS